MVFYNFFSHGFIFYWCICNFCCNNYIYNSNFCPQTFKSIRHFCNNQHEDIFGNFVCFCNITLWNIFQDATHWSFKIKKTTVKLLAWYWQNKTINNFQAILMYTLGISCYYHDSAASLLKDGKVLAAIEEERFSRKNSRRNPCRWNC